VSWSEHEQQFIQGQAHYLCCRDGVSDVPVHVATCTLQCMLMLDLQSRPKIHPRTVDNFWEVQCLTPVPCLFDPGKVVEPG